MPAPAICVVGSINLDMNAYVDRFPKVGETMHGLRFATGYGGKGANQAVMAARMGGAVSFVGSVGDDLFGRDMRANMAAEGISTEYITTSPGLSSGVAVITDQRAGRQHDYCHCRRQRARGRHRRRCGLGGHCLGTRAGLPA